jgi:hypothetical protein
MEQPIGIKYAKAIKEINPNFIGSITGNTESELVIDWKSEAEISVANIQAKITEMETAETDKETAKATAKASGNTKLLALGLTQEEATALTGYTPE